MTAARTASRLPSRSSRIVDYLNARAGQEYSARVLRDALEPRGDANIFSATCNYLAKRGRIHLFKRGNQSYFTSLSTLMSGGLPKAVNDAARKRATNVVCSITGIPEANRSASARIAADIAAFQARGGVIERLGVTKLHHDPAANDDDQDE